MWWSWVLGIIGVAGIFFVGRKSVWGWFVLLFNECLWIAYALITNQHGFIFSALAYAAVYVRSYMHWKADDKKIPQKTINYLKRENNNIYVKQNTFSKKEVDK
jgi:nicotinamide riboside transporter PnuC